MAFGVRQDAGKNADVSPGTTPEAATGRAQTTSHSPAQPGRRPLLTGPVTSEVYRSFVVRGNPPSRSTQGILASHASISGLSIPSL